MPRKTLHRTLATVVAVAMLLVAGQAAFQRTNGPASVTVSWGDSLWSLSQRYGVSVQALAAANHMQVTDVLYAGRTLYLPSHGAPSSNLTVWPYAKAVIPVAIRVVNPQGSFCATYQPPTGSQGQLPAALAGDPGKMALRSTFAHWAAVYGVPLSLIEAEAWQESGWQSGVVSSAGAVGIGQLLPATAAFVNQALGTNLQLTVASDNVRMMAAFLGYLLRSTGGQICDAVAAYYQGLTALADLGVLPVSQIYVRDVLSLRPRFLGT